MHHELLAALSGYPGSVFTHSRETGLLEARNWLVCGIKIFFLRFLLRFVFVFSCHVTSHLSTRVRSASLTGCVVSRPTTCPSASSSRNTPPSPSPPPPPPQVAKVGGVCTRLIYDIFLLDFLHLFLYHFLSFFFLILPFSSPRSLP